VLASTTNTRYPSNYELQYHTPPAYPQLTYRRTCYRNALLHITGLPSFSLLASISYELLVCPHSPRWPTRTRCSSALILLVGQHLVPVGRRPSFSTLAYCSYASLVGTHSPRRPTAPTRRSFDLIFADLHSDVWQKHRVRYRWPTSRACCSFDLIFADLRSDVWQKRRVRYWWPTSRTCCSFLLIRRAGLLVRVSRLPSFSLLANISYLLLIGPHSLRWPTARTRSASALILPYLLLVCVARLPLFSSLAYILYELLVCPYSPRWSTSSTRCSSALMRRRMYPVRRD